MSAQESPEVLRAETEQPASSPERKGRGKADEKAPGNVGRALKTVYDDTLREDVPQDFLDLLGKLS